ncbi:MAG: hypothetical protein ACLFQB_07375 [Chitinispirillaceae bacterium]
MRSEDRDAIRENFLGDEDGHIYFFYRPKALEAHDVQEIDRLYIVLRPFASKTLRLISLDTNQFPEPGSEFNYITGTVERVDSKQYHIVHDLSEKHTQRMGEPDESQGPARPCGEGVYTLLDREKAEHLFYIMELPEKGTVSEKLNILKEGDFVFGVFNPYYGVDPEEMEPTVRPVFPEPLRVKLKNERVVFEDVPRYINFEGTRVALYRQDGIVSKSELKAKLHPQKETPKNADIFMDLRMSRERFPVEPLVKGDFR